MTRLITDLEKRGLVQRAPSERDARAVIVDVTVQGEQMLSRLQQALANTIDEVLIELDATEKKMLEDLLVKALGAAPKDVST
jgi:DNA-binding MarR family transcriptional regulator